MVQVPPRPRSPWLRTLWFALAIALFLVSYSLGNRLGKPKSTPSSTPSLALLIQPPIPLADFQLRDNTGGAVNREALSGHWTLMALAPGEDAVRPWLQQLAAIFNHLASEPEFQGHLLLAPTLPAGEAADNLVPATPPWRLLRGSDAEITRLQGQLGLVPPRPAGSANPELGELLLVIDPQTRLYGTYRFDMPPERIARDLVALGERYAIETEGAPPRGH
jgi:cytochrome oxidase Cu insertion factor (SCO1/SenC/PrrC family)